jgi:hypothetical protein
VLDRTVRQQPPPLLRVAARVHTLKKDPLACFHAPYWPLQAQQQYL